MKNVSREKVKDFPNQIPLELVENLVRLSSDKGDTVLDPFLGSGTTGVACKHLGRNFIGIEINEQYAKLAERRLNGD